MENVETGKSPMKKNRLPVWYISKPMLVEHKDKRYKQFKRYIKTHGYSPDELWALDHTIAAFILFRLKAFRKGPGECSYPGNLTSKQWQRILDDMIAGFEFYANHDGWRDDEAKEGWEKWDKAMKLFVEYFESLWC
jgi:hypothetical protein